MKEQILEAVLPLVSLAITLIFALLTRVIMERMKSGEARDAALELVSAAGTVVRNVEQTMAKELKDAARDGLSEKDYKRLKDEALKQLKDQLSHKATSVIESNSERLETVLERAIESEVHKMKAVPTVTEEVKS